MSAGACPAAELVAGAVNGVSARGAEKPVVCGAVKTLVSGATSAAAGCAGGWTEDGAGLVICGGAIGGTGASGGVNNGTVICGGNIDPVGAAVAAGAVGAAGAVICGGAIDAAGAVGAAGAAGAVGAVICGGAIDAAGIPGLAAGAGVVWECALDSAPDAGAAVAPGIAGGGAVSYADAATGVDKGGKPSFDWWRTRERSGVASSEIGISCTCLLIRSPRI